MLHENFKNRRNDSSTPSTSKAKSTKTPRASSAGRSSAGVKKSRARVHTMVGAEVMADAAEDENDSRVRDFVNFCRERPQCVNVKWLEKREEDNTLPPGFTMCPTLSEILRRCGCGALFKHQADAIRAVRLGKSIVVATPTASGKSLCYVIPIFEAIMQEKSNAKALLMFPLKALANDQLNKMRRFTQSAQDLFYEINSTFKERCGVDADAKSKNAFLAANYPGIDIKRLERLAEAKMAVCDGDTADDVKAEIRKQGTQIILTNPDSLHHAMLPGHKSWGKKFWSNLKLIVLDEAHTHTGVAGSHVANVLRRLLRVCASWDSSSRVEFICTSATISNPVAHVRRLTTRTPVCIDESGAPSGEKAMVLWQPPEAEGTSAGQFTSKGFNGFQQQHEENASASQMLRRSPYAEAADIIANLVQRNIRCLAFVSARKIADSVARDVKTLLVKIPRPDLVSKVDSYRAGYNQSERRALERKLQRGEISALVCTSALEMGIDVGALDATVHVGVPETASAMWQQAGRAGRRCGASVAVVVACERPLDHYYVTRSDELFSRRPEEALCDPHNAAILELHLPCAAREVAIDLRGADSILFSACKEDAVGDLPPTFKSPLHLAVKRALAENRRTCVFNAVTKTIECLPGLYPHRSVMLRGVQSDEAWTLTDASSEPHRVLEQIEGHRAMSRLYVGCIYLARAGQFIVRKLDKEARIAYAAPYEKMENTTTRERTEVIIMSPDPKQGIEEIRSKSVRGTKVYIGSVHVIERVHGFIRKDHFTGKISHEEVWAKPVVSAEYETRACWFDLPSEVVNRRLVADVLREATCGVANVCVGLVGSIAMCDTRDIAGAIVLPSAETGITGVPRIFLYDTTPHGIGIAEKVFDEIETLWSKSMETITQCECEKGCPSCIQFGPKGRDAGFSKRHCKVVFDGILAAWMN